MKKCNTKECRWCGEICETDESACPECGSDEFFESVFENTKETEDD